MPSWLPAIFIINGFDASSKSWNLLVKQFSGWMTVFTYRTILPISDQVLCLWKTGEKWEKWYEISQAVTLLAITVNSWTPIELPHTLWRSCGQHALLASILAFSNDLNFFWIAQFILCSRPQPLPQGNRSRAIEVFECKISGGALRATL